VSSDFAYEFLNAMREEAVARLKGPWWRRLLTWDQRSRTIHDGGRTYHRVERHAGLRFSRRSYMTAVSEAADRMKPDERAAWRADGTLPDGFWEWVDRRAASWDALL
jgi:hypothetical protein